MNRGEERSRGKVDGARSQCQPRLVSRLVRDSLSISGGGGGSAPPRVRIRVKLIDSIVAPWFRLPGINDSFTRLPRKSITVTEHSLT